MGNGAWYFLQVEQAYIRTCFSLCGCTYFAKSRTQLLLEAVSHQRVEDKIQVFVDFLNLLKSSFPNINRHCYELSLFYVIQQLVLNRKWIYQKRRRRKKPWFNMLHFALWLRDLNGKSARSCSMQLWQAWERTIRSSENISFWGCQQ